MKRAYLRRYPAAFNDAYDVVYVWAHAAPDNRGPGDGPFEPRINGAKRIREDERETSNPRVRRSMTLALTQGGKQVGGLIVVTHLVLPALGKRGWRELQKRKIGRQTLSAHNYASL